MRLDEIEKSTAPNAYELLRQVRPNWLRGRGSPDLRGSAPVLPVVYVGQSRYGSVETLRGISRTSLQQMRYIDAPTATTRYGSGHSGGIIMVTIRNR